MTISVRLNDKEMELIRAYAEMNGISLSDLVRKSILEKIEDEYDLKCYNEAMEEYKKNPKTYSIEEVKEMVALWDDENEEWRMKNEEWRMKNEEWKTNEIMKE